MLTIGNLEIVIVARLAPILTANRGNLRQSAIDLAALPLKFLTFIFMNDIIPPLVRSFVRISYNSGCHNRLIARYGRRQLTPRVPIFLAVARYSATCSRIALSVTRECIATKGK
jgi:hypothetical protein